jgi:oligopeptide transport system ATP-binding protein
MSDSGSVRDDGNSVGRQAAVPLLTVEGLSVQFGAGSRAVEVVSDVSYSLQRGESLAILGESGSGKTIAARAIMGLLPAEGRVVSGRVTFDQRDVPLVTKGRRPTWISGTEVAMVFQDALAALNPVFTVGWQISEVFRVKNRMGRRESRAAAIRIMERVGIPDAARRYDAYPHEFSGGMRQRIVIAIAIALEPRLLIADEPTTALDVTVQAQIMELLKELCRETGMALVLITHDLGVVADVADRVLVMYAGRAVESGDVRDVYRRSAHPYTQGLIASSPRADRRVERLVQIPGSPPQPRALPPGCAFHPRCAFVKDRCRSERPELRPVGSGRLSGCHFAEQVVGDGARTSEVDR